mmetsp:Transcript_132624/g.383417  ORF Transcript_132624/g.383417 Transcript_132624/m.383417 type:complete len:444 (+) Transcript_132624:479-1810(+)
MRGEVLGGELGHVRRLADERVRRARRVREASLVHAVGRARDHRELREVGGRARERVRAAGAAHEEQGLHGLVELPEQPLQLRRLLVRGADPDLAWDLELGQLLLERLQVRHVGVRACRDDGEAANEHARTLQVHDDAPGRRELRWELEGVAGHLLVDADVPVGALHDLLLRQLRRLLVLSRVEAQVQQRITDILLRELLQLQLRLCLHQLGHVLELAGLHLRRDLRVLRLPLLHCAHPRGVGRVHLVNNVQNALLVQAELVLRVDEDEPPLAHELGASLVEPHGDLFCPVGHVLADELLHLRHGHVLIVANLRFCGGREKRDVELLESVQAVGHLKPAEGAVSLLVRRGHAAPEVPPHDQLHVQILHALLHDHAGVDVLDQRVGHDVRCLLESPLADHVQDLPLEGDQVRQDEVEGGDAIVRDHDHVLAGEIDGTDLALLLLA